MWILFYWLSLIILLYIILEITWRLWKRKLSFIPSAPHVPWLGSQPYFGGDAHVAYELRKSYNAKFDHIFVFWYGPKPSIEVGRVEYVEALLRSQEHLTKSFLYGILGEWLGDGLLISRKSKWKKRRLALTGAFHFTILNNFMEVYEHHAKELVKKLRSLSSVGKEVEIQFVASLALLDVICETSMGVHINASNTSDSDYVRAIRDVKKLLVLRLANPLYFSKTIYQYTTNGKRYFECLDILHSFTSNIIKENIASRQSHSRSNKINEDEFNLPYRKRKRVFIDVLIDLYEKGEIDIDGIQEEVDTFMFEGHDTTTSALSWTLYEIGRHPEIQEKIHEEIDNISIQDCPLIDKIRSMKYTEIVIKESLRLHPPVPNYDRVLEKDIVVEGNTIPAGTTISIDALSVHMNPAYWDEPAVFNPSRFEKDEKRNPYCYIPFSAGARNCIGQKFAMLEEKVFVFYIMSTFNIKSTQLPHEVKEAADLVTYAENGINIEFTSRE